MKFPQEFLTRLVTVQSWTQQVEVIIDEIASPERDGFSNISLPWRKELSLAVRGLKVYRPPLQSASPNSKAVYLASFEDKDATLLVQFLPPWASTSCHVHQPPVTEAYHVLAGRAYLGYLELLGSSLKYSDLRCLEKGQSSVVKPNQIHRYFTKELPALTLLEIFGMSVEDCLYSKRNHIYFRRPES